ncbi:MAG: cell wall-binding repeat-containing protein [Actinomycetota bacterium]|jgi:putative cell wall-binding protein|nr:cell wall-binding repeat-containing protein [Actinomycetota bacterium]
MYRFIRVLTLLVVASIFLPLQSAHGATVDFFEWNASQESILSEMTTHPAAITVNGKVYIAYQGPGFDACIVSWDPAKSKWDGPYRIGFNTLEMDPHGAPALFSDASGRIHVLYGAHNTALKHSQAQSPGRIDSWMALPDVATKATYPQVAKAADDSIMLFRRSSSADWVLQSADSVAAVFGTEKIILDGDSEAWWYANSSLTDEGTLLIAFARVDTYEYRTGDFSRHDVFFAKRLKNGTWQNAQGQTLPMPITLATAEASCTVFDSGYGLTNEVTVGADTSSTPCAMYLTGRTTGADRFAWRFDRWDGTSWRSAEITTTDHHFDSGSFRALGEGTFEAVLVAGLSDGNIAPAGDMRGRGGIIRRFVSTDAGVTWTATDEDVSPNEPGTFYSSPVIVDGAPDAAHVIFTDWSNDLTDPFRRLFLWGSEGLVPRAVTPVVTRLAGTSRVGTAVSISQEAFPMGTSTVVLATSADFPDALAGAPLAAQQSAPLLLTTPTSLSPEVAQEIERLGATTVVILGGHSAISADVEEQLKVAGVKTVERIWGPSRFETALAISRRLYGGPNSIHKAVVVSGRSWPDACVTGPLAAGLQSPIVLTDGGVLPAASQQILTEWTIWRTIVVGGTMVIPDSLKVTLPAPIRIGGANRYETSALVAEYACDTQLLPHRFVLASGIDFPDALSASTVAARVRGPILLTRPESLPTPVADYVSGIADGVVEAYIAGGERAVGVEPASSLDSILGAD